jgi:hypothetical protein
MGNSLFFVSPLFIYLFKINKKFFKPFKTKIFNLGMMISLPSMLSPALFLFGTGWFQFGHRYLLDIIPFLVVLTIQATDNFKSGFSKFLLVLSCFLNLMGYFWWLSLGI